MRPWLRLDSFTYVVNDGELDSALATVALTINPVNDAPLAVDVSVSVLEDNTVAINLVATDADNTWVELQFGIETQPAHGGLGRFNARLDPKNVTPKTLWRRAQQLSPSTA